ncbi:hypothetical protein TNCT_15431 [Trichonephila clavata]|uniref:Uncharacterized protein n=1 Tax=Trichonephila clavata TaxID=2740835 RepID=A0A8X6FBA3_TRICU|nr:hypothetical protein TNCT_15431 [Trichonephila clavata]
MSFRRETKPHLSAERLKDTPECARRAARYFGSECVKKRNEPVSGARHFSCLGACLISHLEYVMLYHDWVDAR